jgi:hypothetical protein
LRPDGPALLEVACVVTFGVPAILVLRNVWHARREVAIGHLPPSLWNWRLSIASTLLCALAFNVVFLIQELALVVSKALTPGLHPILYHNNHNWTGDNPIARLEQGSGALATVILGLGAVWWLRARNSGSTSWRLFAIWIAFHGLFAALPQVIIGAALPQNDVGMAMEYLRLGRVALIVAVLAALAAIAAAGSWLARPFVALASDPAQVDSAAQRARFVFRAATLPAFASLPLIIAFRVPGEVVQVAIVPVAITCIGIVWVQAAAWLVPVPTHLFGREAPLVRAPLVMLIIFWLFFQLVLRPGIAF